jgi:hypothetical protein
MKKTDKKIENAIVKSLTEVCDVALKGIDGFEWITHFVNYGSVPQSLSVVCVFDTKASLSKVLSSGKDEELRQLIQQKLSTVNIHIKDIQKQVSFDTEEACKNVNGGNWDERFR